MARFLRWSLTARRVIIEGDRATGVKVVPTKPLSPGQLQSRTYKARKFVIVSGGTLSSPLILQRSGVGKTHMGSVQSLLFALLTCYR